MEKLSHKKALIESIRESEGSTFVCDEKAILEEYAKEENKSSITIKILSIFGGFLATLAFVGFLGISGLYNSEIGLLIFGIGFIISAVVLNKVYDKIIVDTFSISVYIIGFVMFGFSLLEMNIDENTTAILISLIALIALVITQNFMLSFVSILTINGCFIFLIISNDLNDLIHLYIAILTFFLCYLFLNEANLISTNTRLSRLYNPMRIGLIMSLLFGLISIGKRGLIPISQNLIWLSSIAMGIAILYLVGIIIKINNVKSQKKKTLIYILSLAIVAATLFSPSISGAIVIILLCFLVNYKTGLVIGIISTIYFISQYYYDLNLTLLTKSIILFVSGILFLLFYVFTIKNSTDNEKI